MVAQVCDALAGVRLNLCAAAHFCDAAAMNPHRAVFQRRATDRNDNARPKDHSASSVSFS